MVSGAAFVSGAALAAAGGVSGAAAVVAAGVSGAVVSTAGAQAPSSGGFSCANCRIGI